MVRYGTIMVTAAGWPVQLNDIYQYSSCNHDCVRENRQELICEHSKEGQSLQACKSAARAYICMISV